MAGITSVSRLDAGAQALRLRLDTLTRQVSDGRKGPGYGDIAPDARRAIDLRADMARRETWQGTIDRTLARSSVVQGALGRLSDIATKFYQQAIKIDGTSGELVSAVAAQARAALDAVLLERALALSGGQRGEAAVLAHLYGAPAEVAR